MIEMLPVCCKVDCTELLASLLEFWRSIDWRDNTKLNLERDLPIFKLAVLSRFRFCFVLENMAGFYKSIKQKYF